MRAPALALLAFTAAAPLPAQSRPGTTAPATIPLTFSDGLLIVPATLADTVSLRVILDTGAGLDVLAPSLIRKVGGRAAGVFTGIRMHGDRVDVPLFVVPRLAVGPASRRDVLVGSWDMLDSLHLDGIISAMAFRHLPITIDFAGRIVTFETVRSLAARRATGRSAPLAVADDRGKALDLFAQFLVGDQPGECELDTGSQGSTVSTRYLTALGIDSSGPDVTRSERRTITGARERRYDAQVSRVALSGSPEIGVAQPRVTFSDIIYDCVIGNGFWAGHALTLDVPARRLTVSGSPASGGPPSR